MTAFHDKLLLGNGGMNNEKKLTIKNIDVTQETRAQFRADKKKIGTKLQKTAEERQIGFDPECTWDWKNRDQRG